MVRVRLDVAYDGTDFSGWAVQPDRRTVAGVLGFELERILGAGVPTGLTVAGRTDAGVHATGQVCHVDLPDEAWAARESTLLRRLAGLLPGDIRVTRAVAVPAAFDARFSALFRRYAYRVTDAPYGAEPLRRRDTLAWARPLDVTRLNAAAQGLLGEHDFAAFCKRKEHATTKRAISIIEWQRQDDGVIVATVQADAFCQAMVRSLVGAMLSVGDGRREPDWPGSLLTRTARADDVPVVGPHGLTLVAVGYPDDESALAERADATRRLRV
ncbi:tRNA pseudouridine38-40 synthase [Allocatelliglobosispora scoriae]|uniref:tRNA pseudouridine synthase A n=1 Tax=Allocatelliglobosispora scoriae TaxID=643052 RepID=A0A841BUS4_9ACTN|nr:tRNA pseudouridine(38-40) synthase TruA [Allocatelliglobosispora scoriae]MBB5870501.1 tRNA pseudouridine38-40 synthase [Allocatelliglobosispora scoriae]